MISDLWESAEFHSMSAEAQVLTIGMHLVADRRGYVGRDLDEVLDLVFPLKPPEARTSAAGVMEEVIRAQFVALTAQGLRVQKRSALKATDEEFWLPLATAEGLGEPFAEAFRAWLAHKRERRDKYTRTGMGRCIKQLGGIGEERAVAAINFSLEKQWAGIYEDKNRATGATTNDERRDALRRV